MHVADFSMRMWLCKVAMPIRVMFESCSNLGDHKLICKQTSECKQDGNDPCTWSL